MYLYDVYVMYLHSYVSPCYYIWLNNNTVVLSFLYYIFYITHLIVNAKNAYSCKSVPDCYVYMAFVQLKLPVRVY